MKKIYLLLTSLVLMLLLVSCNPAQKYYDDLEDSLEEFYDNAEDVLEDYYDDVEDILDDVYDDVDNFYDSDNDDTDNSSEKVDWQQFLKEYEAWVDSYIKVIDKYNSNPSDYTIMNEYFDLLGQYSDWTEKTLEVQESLENASPKDVAKYSAELARIAKKLSDSMY